MRLDATFAVCLVPIVVFAVMAPRLASDWASRPRTTADKAADATVLAARQPAAASGTARIKDRGDGHYAVEARIGARRVPFMVDTGATLVALSWETGRDLGLVSPSDPMTVPIVTANGTVKAKRITIDRLDVEGVEVDDVPALVLPQGALSTNLLGMSYLSRLGRFEFAKGTLVLEN